MSIDSIAAEYGTTAAKYVEQVFKNLPEILDLQDKQMVESEVLRLLISGWEITDIVSYICCMEEVNPSLNEDIAIQRMNEIRSKYCEAWWAPQTLRK